jgi:hypothetical protein
MDDNLIVVEWLILADSAQVVGSKLFLLGGGWDVLTVNSEFPVQHFCAVAAAFRVPWTETNRPFAVEIEVVDEDDGSLARLAAQAEVGRPPGITPGQPQRTQIAATISISFPHPGTYAVIARVEGQEKHVPFNVVPGPMLRLRPDPAQGSA